jgi:hypothetical protein
MDGDRRMSGLREEGPAGVLAGLHNSGAAPREVFRTAAIGRVVHFDLAGARDTWDRAGRIAREVGESARKVGGVPSVIHACLTAAVLQELGAEVPLVAENEPDAQARRLLGVLVETLRGRGALDDLVGLAFHEQRTDASTSVVPDEVSTLEMARTLAVYAVYAPPLLLWSRSPSLGWMRSDTLIGLRLFDSPALGEAGS